MKKIIEIGAVISEYPPGTAPKAYHFPERNKPLSIDDVLFLFKEEKDKVIEQIAIIEIEVKVKCISGGTWYRCGAEMPRLLKFHNKNFSCEILN